ncbi:unnamed protein product [Brassica rapa subsp. trilocularis]
MEERITCYSDQDWRFFFGSQSVENMQFLARRFQIFLIFDEMRWILAEKSCEPTGEDERSHIF